jgi:hypothetical protein
MWYARAKPTGAPLSRSTAIIVTASRSQPSISCTNSSNRTTRRKSVVQLGVTASCERQS